MNGLKKRSLTIAGHATSITLEEPFWRELRRIAASQGISLAGLVAGIDAGRAGNLSSALRVFVLETVQGQSGVPHTGSERVHAQPGEHEPGA